MPNCWRSAQAAAALGSERLADCDLYVTLEPCTMCAAAMSFARIRRLYFGAADPKGGAVEHGVRFFSPPTCHHRPEVYGGINENECAALLKDFLLRGVIAVVLADGAQRRRPGTDNPACRSGWTGRMRSPPTRGRQPRI